ncbi:MAG: hypothetical protein KUG77_04200, partial [Nannocystaceae bacterium]|nr:hypothetical protein [Nannocystaceae bacterium]
DLGRRTLHALDGVTACTLDLPPAPPRAMRLGQRRFGSARLSRDAVFLGAHVFTPERDEAGDRFAWLGRNAALSLPAGTARLQLRLDVPNDMAGAVLTLSSGSDNSETTLCAGPAAVALRLSDCSNGCEAVVSVNQRHHATDDRRQLTVRLEGAWVEGPAHTPAYGRWSPGHPRTLRAHDVALRGFEAPEVFAHERRGAWTHASAYASFPARAGVLRLRVARPEHTTGDVTIATDAESQTLSLGAKITTVTLRTTAPAGRALLEFRSPTFIPAEVRPDTDDHRNLGLILYEVEFLPNGDRCRPDGVSSPFGEDAQP